MELPENRLKGEKGLLFSSNPNHSAAWCTVHEYTLPPISKYVQYGYTLLPVELVNPLVHEAFWHIGAKLHR